MPDKFKCTECGLEVAGDTGIDPYAHLLSCFHLQPGDYELLSQQAAHRGGEYERRVQAYLAYLKQAGG